MIVQHAPENEWTIRVLNVQPDDHILEIGFGAGYSIERLTNVATQGLIAGVDFSQTMVDETSKRNASAISAGRVDLRMADAALLPFGDCSFYKVFSIHSIYFWLQPLHVLNEIMRVLRPGGMLVITLLPRASPTDIGNSKFRTYTGADLSALLHVGGFRDMNIRDGRTITQKSNYSVVGYKPVS